MVNINDIKENTIPVPDNDNDMMDLMFNRQEYLIKKYMPIEQSNGQLPTKDYPIDIDDRLGQERLRDFAYYCVQEVGEAIEALEEKDLSHYHEELIDGYHFLLELLLLSGYTSKTLVEGNGEDKLEYLSSLLELPHIRINGFLFVVKMLFRWKLIINKSKEDFLHIQMIQFIKELTSATNCLKNKPWKQTEMLTNKDKYFDHLRKAFITYHILLKMSGLSANGIFKTYFKKSEVNKQRIESEY